MSERERRRLLGAHTETVELPASTALERGVHTFDVVGDGDGGYHGYAGPVREGVVEHRRATDRRAWTITDQPLFTGDGHRWPTAIRHEGVIYLAVRTAAAPTAGDVAVLTAEGRTGLVRRLKNAYRLAVRGQKLTSIHLYRSPDGTSFSRVGPLVAPRHAGNVQNGNPFLFRAVDGRVGLVHVSSNLEHRELRCRLAAAPTDLPDAPAHTLLRADSVLAAPAMFHHPVREEYVLLAERLDGDEWVTTAYTSERPDGGFSLAGEVLLYEEDVACPFPHVDGEDLWLFLSRREDAATSRWTGLFHRYDLWAARTPD